MIRILVVLSVLSVFATPINQQKTKHPTAYQIPTRSAPPEASRSLLRPQIVALPVSSATPPPTDLTDPPVVRLQLPRSDLAPHSVAIAVPVVASGKSPRPGLPAVPARAVVARPATVATGETSPEPTAQQWHQLAVCESGDVVGQRANPRYRGWLQIGYQEWSTYGGVALTGVTDPADATGAQQLVVAERIYAARGSEPWSCGRWLR